MSAVTSLSQKVARLRGLEPLAYQTAYFLLQDEEAAAEATKVALLEISQHDGLNRDSPEQLRSLIKKLAIRAALVKPGAYMQSTKAVSWLN
ncbi:hypothetical protein [Paenibacillus paridis]|uniref:hypothetical protein n=1 Tax=Paenibacillus paridis TaxID=2583376 RepID=UPI00111D6DFA|nr:hypothetical protein [Paenibacillus paridis]